MRSALEGSAADICKRAMISIAEDLDGTDTHMLVQVHDEIVAAVPVDTAHDLKPLFINAMGEGKIIRGVPLKVSCRIAGSWSEAKGK